MKITSNKHSAQIYGIIPQASASSKQSKKPFALRALLLQLQMRRLEIIMLILQFRMRVLEIRMFLSNCRQFVTFFLYCRSYRSIFVSRLKVKLILTRIFLLQTKERFHQFFFRHFF
jgi:hypothetical protein